MYVHCISKPRNPHFLEDWCFVFRSLTNGWMAIYQIMNCGWFHDMHHFGIARHFETDFKISFNSFCHGMAHLITQLKSIVLVWKTLHSVKPPVVNLLWFYFSKLNRFLNYHLICFWSFGCIDHPRSLCVIYSKPARPFVQKFPQFFPFLDNFCGDMSFIRNTRRLEINRL